MNLLGQSRQSPRGACALLAAALLGACAGGASMSARPGDGKGTVVLADGLVQEVTVSPVAPTTGSPLSIRSVIVNRGSTTVTLESRVCSLAFSGTLALQEPPASVRCLAYSMTGPLAPGDSVVATDAKRVASPPGHYVLRVEHAVHPTATVEVPLTVVGAP